MDTKQLMVSDRQAVRKVFGKSDQNVDQDIEIIREWVKSQPHLPEIPSDHMIEVFLTMNKYSIELTKTKLDMYYTIKALIPEVYENSHPLSPRMLNMSQKMGIFLPLPKPTEDNYRVFVLRPTENVDYFNANTYISYMINIYEMRIQHDMTLGDIYIVDNANVKLGHVTKIMPSHAFKLATIAEKVFLNRFKGMHVVNYAPFMDMLLAVGKRIMKPKLFSRIYLHNSIEEVYDYVPTKLLPKDYGGDQPPLQELSDMWDQYMADNSERFDKLAVMKVKEELRPTPLKNDEILGYYGNFKQLDVD